MIKYDQRNVLKLHISTYLQESLTMVGQLMLEDIFNKMDKLSIEEAQEYLVAHYDNNIFELIAPFLQGAGEEYEAYKHTPEGKEAFRELKEILDESLQDSTDYETPEATKKNNNEDEGNGNVH